MYSNLKNVQILLSLLKEYEVKKIVLSSGMTSVPIIHSVEGDDYFECFSVVDERSAAYFALGLAQESCEPVAIVCTSGTAVCNYMPAITEAYYQKVPLIVITCDKRPYELGQHVLQKINQSYIYGDKCVFSAEIPFVVDNETENYCVRQINQALVNAFIKEKGPVHLNIYTGGNRKFEANCLPKARKIEYCKPTDTDIFNSAMEKLKNSRKILVIVGQGTPYSNTEKKIFNEFEKTYNCVFITDHMGNLDIENVIHPFRVLESMSITYFEENVMPDIVISCGGNILSGKINEFLSKTKLKYEHWLISENGEFVDPWGHLTKLFACEKKIFFEEFIGTNGSNNYEYFNKWNKIILETPQPHFPFSHMYIAEKLAEKVPEKSIVHLGILNSTRVAQFYNFRKEVTVYSNIGALGIDGSLSSFLGQASCTDKQSFLLIGDLSFFYDMGAINIRYLKKNINIILINNGGGGEFYFNIGKNAIPCIDDYIAASHFVTAKAWVEDRGFKYYSAHNEREFDAALEDMMETTYDGPKIIEAFTNKDTEADNIHQYYENIAHRTTSDEVKQKVKHILKSVLGDEITNKGINGLNGKR
jgi:2-succinyl-5-enolpyruvyl-6-hydroxy-3-cyclohexene-1-carboxylate synthase